MNAEDLNEETWKRINKLKTVLDDVEVIWVKYNQFYIDFIFEKLLQEHEFDELLKDPLIKTQMDEIPEKGPIEPEIAFSGKPFDQFIV